MFNSVILGLLLLMAALVLAVPLMHFIAFIDPVRESISHRTYSISVFSIIAASAVMFSIGD
jgi:hypothetical protein